MKMAFYKAQYGGLGSALIAIFTAGPFSHVELVFDEAFRPLIAPVLKPATPPLPPGAKGSLCFSSMFKEGVRFKEILLDHQWEVVDLPISPEAEHEVLDRALSMNGQPYDVMGIVGFVSPKFRPLAGTEFCSESDIRALQAEGLLAGLNPGRTSPNALYRALMEPKAPGRA